ncbi:DHA2 family efflux MFS transporter permease subunit [Parvibaculum sp.]|uniref:DHA2 family efflux MFS transporter permease subunit n=1 Tax=Parvibaculum sp. TaxID=2024848 RepID=UPI0025E36E97|nr:DHA2 family efflux MFS transporter permease subunit [Parvibaculum sp.]
MNPSLQRLIVTGSIMLATIMQTLDSTIANVALPHMQGSFSATQEQISWVLTSYIVAAAVFTPTTGFLASRFGRRNLLAAAVIGFTVTSMLCGAATSIEEIVLFRLLQGMFGAALVPLSQAILLDTYPQEQHGSAMAVWGMGVMVGPILGPALGGWLTDTYNWRWVFYINVPFGLLALVGIFAASSEREGDRSRRFDWMGFAWLGLAIASLQIMLDRGQVEDWFSSTEIVIEAAVAILAFYLFIVHSMTTKSPFITLHLFKDRNLCVGLVLITMVGVILFATMALLPPYLETLMGYPVVTTGLVLAPRGIGTMIAMFLVGRIVNRVDIRLIMAFGFLLTIHSLWEMSNFNLYISETTVVMTGVIQGFGLGFIFVPLTTATFATLSPELRTEGTSLYSLMRNIGSSVGISITQGLISRYTQVNHELLSRNVSELNPLLRPDQAPPGWDVGTAQGLAMAESEVTRQAASIAYLNDFKLMMYMTIFALPLLLLLRVKKNGAAEGGAPAAAAHLD